MLYEGRSDSPVPSDRAAELAAQAKPERGAAAVLPWLCAVGALWSWYAAGDMAFYLRSLSASKLAKPPQPGLLIGILVLLLLWGLGLAAAAWRVRQPQAPSRMVAADWSSGWAVLWAASLGVFLLVNYPIPAQAHHLDKFLLGLLGGIVWTGWWLVRPQTLARATDHRLVRWLGIGLVNGLVFVLVGEVAVRLADPLLARSGLFGDKQTPANLKPHMPVRGSIGISNSQGFRDRERTVERIGPAPRVLALGDSFTWGAGVSYDEAFVTLLERSLQATSVHAEVINVGVPSWGPSEELHLLKAYGLRFQPDLVVLNFFLGNDIQNKRGNGLVLSRSMIVAGQSYYVHSNGNWLHDRFGPDRWFLYHDLNYLLTIGGMRIRQAIGGGERDVSRTMSGGETAPLVSREQYVRGIHERSDIYLADDTPFFAQHWDRTKLTLREFRTVLAEQGVGLLLVVIPDHVQLDGGLQREYLAAVGQDSARYDFDKPRRLLLAWCREQGIPTVDLLPAFEATGRPDTLYFQNDFHLTAQGHQLAAQVIGPLMQAQLATGIGVKEHTKR